MIEVVFTDDQDHMEVDAEAFRRAALEVHRRHGLTGTISVAVVDDEAIRACNHRFLGEDRPTDVLAFALEDDFDEPGAPSGEILVSAETALATARRLGQPPGRELLRYVVHGLLHLTGFDDCDPDEASRMWSEQEEILVALSGKPGEDV